jgi:hypothetical protein
MSKTYTITLSDAQDKALSASVMSQQDWIENAVFERCRIAIEEIVNAEVQRKLANNETISGSKEDIVMAANVETVAEANERLAAEAAARANA